MSDAVEALIWAEGLPDDYRTVVERHWRPLAEDIAAMAKRPLIIGINGAQGSGKSTLSQFLAVMLNEAGTPAISLSLDNLYLTRAEREQLARDVHPLFLTRGVPGTHDVARGMAVLEDLTAGRETEVLRFDKSIDDRLPAGVHVAEPIEVVLFEGWCVGAVPQAAAALREPINALESEEDADGVWRREINRRLATDYAELFGLIDRLIMLKIDSFASARTYRGLQEEKLARTRPGGSAIMDAAALDRFMMHYERLTRWMLEEMPGRADKVIPIGPDQRPV
jgi:D-glycerate 3-kinase